MNGKIAAIFFALPMGAMCTDPTTCAMNYMRYNSADNCCEDDSTKCGPNKIVECGADKYKDTSKYGTSTTNGAVAACCTAMIMCNSTTVCDSMIPGLAYKEKSDVGGTKCNPQATDATSCLTKCCELDTLKCGGTASGSQTCDADKFWDSAKANAAVDGAPLTNCCTAKATCDAVTCLAASGYKVKTGATSTTKCTGTATVSCPMASECCELDATICASMSNSDCGTGKVKNTTVAGSTARGSDAAATCCKTAPAATNAPVCAGSSTTSSTGSSSGTSTGTTTNTLTSGAVQLQWKAMNVIVTITGAAAALWK